MKPVATYSLKAPEGSPDDVINEENQNKYVAFYGGIFTLDMASKEKSFTINPFLGGGLVGKTIGELESVLGREELIELTNVCSIKMLLSQLRKFNEDEFDRACKEVMEENCDVPESLKRKPENL